MLLRFVDERFKDDHEATIGVEFGTKIMIVNELSIKMQIWDTVTLIFYEIHVLKIYSTYCFK